MFSQNLEQVGVVNVAQGVEDKDAALAPAPNVSEGETDCGDEEASGAEDPPGVVCSGRSNRRGPGGQRSAVSQGRAASGRRLTATPPGKEIT